MIVDYSKERHKLAKIADFICTKAKHYSATSSAVYLSATEGHDLVIANNKIDTLEFKGGYNVCITVYAAGKTATLSTADINEVALDRAIANLCSKLKYLQIDEFAGLPDKDKLVREYIELSLQHDWSVNLAKQIDVAKDCEAIALSTSNKISKCQGVAIGAASSSYVYANSDGLLASYSASSYSMSCSLLAAASNMQRDHAFTVARDPRQLLAINDLAQLAVARTVARIGAHSIAPRNTSVVFSASVARSLIKYFLSAISGGNIYLKASFLRDCIGKEIFPKFVNILDQPHLPGALGSSYCDVEGVATKERFLVKEGVLCGYLLSSYSARQLGMETTANAGGAHNVTINNSNINKEQLFRKMGTGLYITELLGQGVNLTTGDFSKGAFGYWVENGVIVHPVDEITLAANLKNMFAEIVAVGSDIDTNSAVITGSWLISNMTVAGLGS